MITKCVREYLNYLNPGNRRYLKELRWEAEEDEVPITRRNSECFFHALFAGFGPLRVLELGTAVDYSALVMAEELLPFAHITTVEGYAPHIVRVKENLARYGVGRITLIEGDVSQVLREQLDESHDFLLLNAAKERHAKWLPELLQVFSPGDTLFPDNALQGSGTAEPRSVIGQRDQTIHNRMHAYLEQFSRTKGIRTPILPVDDRLTLSIKV